MASMHMLALTDAASGDPVYIRTQAVTSIGIDYTSELTRVMAGGEAYLVTEGFYEVLGYLRNSMSAYESGDL